MPIFASQIGGNNGIVCVCVDKYTLPGQSHLNFAPKKVKLRAVTRSHAAQKPCQLSLRAPTAYSGLRLVGCMHGAALVRRRHAAARQAGQGQAPIYTPQPKPDIT